MPNHDQALWGHRQLAEGTMHRTAGGLRRTAGVCMRGLLGGMQVGPVGVADRQGDIGGHMNVGAQLPVVVACIEVPACKHCRERFRVASHATFNRLRPTA